MAKITWEKMIAAARHGDYERLCIVLEGMSGHALTQAYRRDLANLIRDAIGNNLGLKPKRPKRSLESQALLDQKNFMRVSVVAKRMKEEARRRGKQLRGDERKQVFGEILKSLRSPVFREVTLEDLEKLGKLPEARRRYLPK
jgi:hypothetical protein